MPDRRGKFAGKRPSRSHICHNGCIGDESETGETMARRSTPQRTIAQIGSAILVALALAWQAVGGALPASLAPSPEVSTATTAAVSTPDGWQTWNEAAAPNYVREVGPAQVRKEVEPGQVCYSPLDELGRPGIVAANLTHEMREQAKERGRQDIDVDPAGWPSENPKARIETPGGDTYSGRFWNRSHLLADSLGGDPTRENLVTGTRMQNAGGNDNEGGMAYGEQIARAWLDGHESGTLYYSATPLYVGGERIPRAVIVDMRSSDGSIDTELIVYNAAKGYEVNYETGVVTRER